MTNPTANFDLNCYYSIILTLIYQVLAMSPLILCRERFYVKCSYHIPMITASILTTYSVLSTVSLALLSQRLSLHSVYQMLHFSSSTLLKTY